VETAHTLGVRCGLGKHRSLLYFLCAMWISVSSNTVVSPNLITSPIPEPHTYHSQTSTACSPAAAKGNSLHTAAGAHTHAFNQHNTLENWKYILLVGRGLGEFPGTRESQNCYTPMWEAMRSCEYYTVTEHWCFILVILGPQVAEIRRMVLQGQPRQIVQQTLSQKFST
jgi:hypothetical protein